MSLLNKAIKRFNPQTRQKVKNIICITVCSLFLIVCGDDDVAKSNDITNPLTAIRVSPERAVANGILVTVNK